MKPISWRIPLILAGLPCVALTFRTASGEYGKRAAAAFPGSSGALHLDKIATAAANCERPGRVNRRTKKRGLSLIWF